MKRVIVMCSGTFFKLVIIPPHESRVDEVCDVVIECRLLKIRQLVRLVH